MSQHSLIAMFEKLNENLDKGEKCGALFVDSSKAFDCLQHDLLLAKLNAYGFNHKSLKIISRFLSNKNYRTEQKLIYLSANGNISLLTYHRDLS